MAWQDSLEKGEAFARKGDWDSAGKMLQEINFEPEALAIPRVQRFAFHVACAFRLTDFAQQAADMLRQSPEDEDLFTAASWYHTLAAEALEAGDKDKAQSHLNECLMIAPHHAERFMADPRIKGLEGPPPPAPRGWKRPGVGSKIDETVEDPAATEDYKLRYAKAAAHLAAGRLDEVGKIVGTFSQPELFLRSSIRLMMDLQMQMEDYANAEPFAHALLYGNQEDRKMAGLWYLAYGVQKKQSGDIIGALNLLNEAVAELPEYRKAFASDPRIKGLVDPG